MHWNQGVVMIPTMSSRYDSLRHYYFRSSVQWQSCPKRDMLIRKNALNIFFFCAFAPIVAQWVMRSYFVVFLFFLCGETFELHSGTNFITRIRGSETLKIYHTFNTIYTWNTQIIVVLCFVVFISSFLTSNLFTYIRQGCFIGIEVIVWLLLWQRWQWWRHQMETFSALLAICAGNSPVTGEFPTKRPVTRTFDVFFDLRQNKRLSKQS